MKNNQLGLQTSAFSWSQQRSVTSFALSCHPAIVALSLDCSITSHRPNLLHDEIPWPSFFSFAALYALLTDLLFWSAWAERQTVIKYMNDRWWGRDTLENRINIEQAIYKTKTFIRILPYFPLFPTQYFTKVTKPKLENYGSHERLMLNWPPPSCVFRQVRSTGN